MAKCTAQHTQALSTAMTQPTVHYSGLTVTAAQATAQTAAYEVPGNYPTFVSGYRSRRSLHLNFRTHNPNPNLQRRTRTCTQRNHRRRNLDTQRLHQRIQPTAFAIADGYNTWFNGYDNQIYVVGKGPTTTTVTAPNTGLEFGQSVVIRGTVTDVSSGTQQDEQAARFVNGVPVASDAQHERLDGICLPETSQHQPTSPVLTVTINVVDANGNYRNNRHNHHRRNRHVQPIMDTRHCRRLHSHRNLRRHKRLLGLNCSNYLHSRPSRSNSNTNANTSTIRS